MLENFLITLMYGLTNNVRFGKNKSQINLTSHQTKH